jgi:hypothetical protein
MATVNLLYFSQFQPILLFDCFLKTCCLSAKIILKKIFFKMAESFGGDLKEILVSLQFSTTNYKIQKHLEVFLILAERRWQDAP